MDDFTMDAVGIITYGRVGFSETFRNIFQTQAPLRHGVLAQGGPYWEQSLTALVKQALSTPAKYLLFFDGDSVFTRQDCIDMYKIIESDETMDSIGPVQADRNGDLPLCYNWKFWKKTEYDYKKPVMQIWHGHFGCTLIRADVFRNMALPWFNSQPATDNTWDAKPGKLDADTWFWVRLAEDQAKTGHWCAQANSTVIGHMELIIRWQDGDKVQLQSVPQFYHTGKPYGLRAPMFEEVGEDASHNPAVKLDSPTKEAPATVAQPEGEEIVL